MGRHDFLYQDRELSHRSIAVYLYLEDRANENGECWPSLNRMASELKLSRSTIRRALRDLREAKLVTTRQRYRANGGKSSLCYKIKKE